MFVLGLTGSIGMGKTTAANMFRRLGCPVHDADRTVHDLLAPGGAAVSAIARQFPGVLNEQGGIDRQKLGAVVFGDDDALRRLEAILHPMVRAAEERFLKRARARRQKLAVLDIPLLFETGGDKRCDAVAVVTAPLFMQRTRVLKRPGMTAEKFQNIRARQMPEHEKMRRARWVLKTGQGKLHTFRRIKNIVAFLEQG
ncbi:Dephospho-CoA kinase [Rhodospirillaceae bacterium LM-1]|nr:Dephospho-CoA kinase [Rhodospirillaceae bacterium LM-1]